MFKRFLALVCLSFVLIAFTFQFPLLRSSISNWFQSTSRPVLQAFSLMSAQAMNLRSHFYNYWDAIEKQKELESQIEEQASQLVKLAETLRENERLRNLLDFRESLQQKAVGARVIGFGLKPWKKSILLDKGSSQKLKPMSVLVVPAGLVGRVVEVGPLTSQAILLTDPDSRVTAMTLNSRAQGMIEGNGTDKLKLRYLNLDDQVQVGETVVTSGVSDIFPKGLNIGVVESMERDADGLHLAASVRPVVRFSKLEELLCLDPSESK